MLSGGSRMIIFAWVGLVLRRCSESSDLAQDITTKYHNKIYIYVCVFPLSHKQPHLVGRNTCATTEKNSLVIYVFLMMGILDPNRPNVFLVLQY